MFVNSKSISETWPTKHACVSLIFTEYERNNKTFHQLSVENDTGIVTGNNVQ